MQPVGPGAARERALALVLLGRVPAKREFARRGWWLPAWRETAAAILRSNEFRERVLAPFLAHEPIPQHRLPEAGLRAVAVLLARLGVPPPQMGAGWVAGFAAFIAAERYSPILEDALGAEAAPARERARRVLGGFALAEKPIADADLSALYVLLLGRLPENAARYDAERGRRRGDLIAAMLHSHEFRDAVAARLLVTAAPRNLLGEAAIEATRTWLGTAGFALPPDGADWAALVAEFLAHEPAATRLWQALPDPASRFAARLSAIRTMRRAVRAPLSAADVKAVHLFVLGRMPESFDVYARYRGRPRAGLIGDLMRTAEFRDLILHPLLAGAGLPQDRLGVGERQACIEAARRFAILPGPGEEWRRLVLGFLLDVCPWPESALFRPEHLAGLAAAARQAAGPP